MAFSNVVGNNFEHTVLYALAIWFGAMNAANAGTGDETLPRYSGEAFNSGVIHILPSDIVINSKIVKRQYSNYKNIKDKVDYRIWGAGSKKYLWKK